MNENYEGRRCERADECDVPTFGHPVGNDGWIQCKSKTFPGKYYYFNVDSRSRTWGRPLASCVPVPIVNSVNLPRDEDFWEDAPIEVSDIEDDDDEEDFNKENIDTKPPNIGAKEARMRKTFTEVLFKLYHCYGDDFFNDRDIVDFTTSNDASLICKSEIAVDIDGNDESPSILPEICYSSSSDEESCEAKVNVRQRSSRLASATLAKKRKNKINDFPVWWGCPNWAKLSNTDCRRIRKLELSSSEDSIERQVVNFWPSRQSFTFSNKKDSRQNFTRLDMDSEDAEDEDDEEELEDEEMKEEVKMEAEEINDNPRREPSHFFLPRLKAIQLSDLITDPKRPKIPVVPAKRKVPVVAKEISVDDPPPKKVTKIICEMNGIKTINYDFPDPELPPGVKVSNLSDTGSSSTEMAYNKWAGDRTAKSGEQIGFMLKDGFMDIEEPCLSDSATSSSSSSSSGSTITKRSNGGESDSSESSSSSSSSSGSSSTTRTLTGSISDKLKKEEPVPKETFTPRARKLSIVKLPVVPNLYCKKKLTSESSGSSRSSCNEDPSWNMSESQTDDDE